MAVKNHELMKRVITSRKKLVKGKTLPVRKEAEEGGCGVVGFAASVPIRGRHIFEPSMQMHNRGNGKGGGIALSGLNSIQMGVTEETLRDNYLVQLALFDDEAEEAVEKEHIGPFLEVKKKKSIEPAADWKDLGLPIEPPAVTRYFVRVKEGVLQKFADEHGLADLTPRELEDEFIYQNSAALNGKFYSSLGEKRAFVLSHGRDLAIFKIVGYAENVVQYYGLEDMEAQVWIAHQRYPTKGRVWHPAGSHPFIGMNEALVHNGDFANYYAVSEYLKQHNIMPQFLTDTEVSVQLFDLWRRTYKYPLEYVIEAMAPTGEADFDQLSPDKQEVYKQIQALHVHGSPDGPWFFILARSNPDENRFRLLGITDTSMLRPQVFALQEGEVSIGLVASEKQAIDATLKSLHEEDKRFRLVADRYWNARGGSHTDGGAFSFTVERNNGTCKLVCADKFGKSITAPPGEFHIDLETDPEEPADADVFMNAVAEDLDKADAYSAFLKCADKMGELSINSLRWLVRSVVVVANQKDDKRLDCLELLTLLNNRRYDCGSMRRSALLQVIRDGIGCILDAAPPINEDRRGSVRMIDWSMRSDLRPPKEGEKALAIFGRDFPPEGDECDALLGVEAFKIGWRRLIYYGLTGQRFHGCGFGPDTDGLRIDIYGSSGDYLASGIDGMEMYVHDNGQDQLGQILKRGKLVVYGDVGQAFMYGAKGGSIYIMGNGAGRPLINAAGRPRVVINGTCLDFLAESFMAGNPLKGGGFVIVNGIAFDDKGKVVEQETPYPGSNLFSLASGGAIYVRDPHRKLIDEQLNGGVFNELTEDDWRLVLPYLEENERLFGISIEDDLLTVDGEKKSFKEVYRKVQAVKLTVLAKAEVPE